MKGRFLVALFLYLAFAVVFSGCRTVDTVEGQTAHHVALQALTSGNCKIVLEEIYIPSDRPEKLRTQQVSGSYFVIKGDKLRAYLTREVDGSKLFSGISPLNGGEADLQIGEPEVRNNGDVNISLPVQGSRHYRVFEWVMTLYHDSNQCSVQANKVYMAGNYSFKGRILPLPEK